MQNIYALIQKENAQRLLMQGYADMWRVMLQISEDAWIAKTHSPANCTPTWCYGMVVYYVPQVTKVLCSFHVLPVLIDSNFLKPQIDGTHIDEHNVTYQLQDCVPTDRGPVCNGLVRAVEPCLLTHAINVCHFTVFPVANYSVLYEIQSQHDLIRMELPSPFVGCIEHLEVLFWFDKVFFLLPDLVDDVQLSWVPRMLPIPQITVSLPISQILRNSEELKAHLKRNER